MNDIESEFHKIFGDMYLSESETALRIFEYGYKAGLEEAAKVCDEFGEEWNRTIITDDISAAIRGRMK